MNRTFQEEGEDSVCHFTGNLLSMNAFCLVPTPSNRCHNYVDRVVVKLCTSRPLCCHFVDPPSQYIIYNADFI